MLDQCKNSGLIQLDNDPVPYIRVNIRESYFSEEMKYYLIKLQKR